MPFDLNKTYAVLERTPKVLKALLEGLPEGLTSANEGGDSWSPFDIVGHLLNGEKTDWIARTKIILSSADNKTFEPFDRFAQLKDNQGKKLSQLLDAFESNRQSNLKELKQLNITDEMLERTGVHPALGEVTLRQLLSTWMTHDLNHIYQISRVLAKQQKEDCGPWVKFLRTLND